MPINDKQDVLISRYKRRNVPQFPELHEALRQYLIDEFQQIENVLRDTSDAHIQVADAEPDSPRKGTVRYSVLPWNPLGNNYQGLVVYNGTSWVAV